MWNGIGGANCGGNFLTQPPLYGCMARANAHEQLRQAPGPEIGGVFGGERGFGG